MSKVVVFGSMNMDLSIDAPRMPAAGETLSGFGFITAAGGKGANQAVAAARLGADVRMIAAVGADGFGEELARGLSDAGADVLGAYPTVGEATSALCGESYVACGSITLAGELAALFR